jgi:hypothetical protein
MRHFRPAILAAAAAFLVETASFAPAHAGVVNPDISVIGQPFLRVTDDAGDAGRKRPVLDVGETEAVFDAYLNPYARGTFILAIGDEGLEVEEGFFTMQRGLPGGLALKGGKYRAGFGKMNPVHPHALPFAERFRVLSAYLPGEESLNETGISLSERIPVPGDFSLTVAGDWLQGDSFRMERESSGDPSDPLEISGPEGDRPEEPRGAFLGRVSGFGQIGERSGYELGLSAAQGTNNVAARARTLVLGADLKLKLWNSPQSYLLVQAEALRLRRDDAGWDPLGADYATSRVTSAGGYVYADYNFNTRYNVGVGLERFQDATADKTSNTAFKLFAGYSLLEETTAFRLDWDRFQAGTPPGTLEDPEAVNTLTLRVIFSMGPHKAHQF